MRSDKTLSHIGPAPSAVGDTAGAFDALTLAIDVDAAISFLMALDPDGRHHLDHAPPDGHWIGRTFQPSSWQEIRDYLQNVPPGQNVFYSLNEPADGAPDKKLSKQDIGRIRVIGIDLDLRTDMPPAEAEKDVEQRTATLCAHEPRPSLLIHSGGGRHALWQLAEKIDAADGSREVEATAKAIAARFGGDATHDVNRVFRLPGTINYPSAAKRARGRLVAPVRVLASSADTARLDSLRGLFSIPSIPAVETIGPQILADHRSEASTYAEEYGRTALRADYVTDEERQEFDSLDTRFAEAMAQSRPLEAVWGGRVEAAPKDKSGSGWISALAYRLAEAGDFSAVDFARLVARWTHPNVDPDKYDPESDAGARQVARAWADASPRGIAARLRRTDPGRWTDQHEAAPRSLPVTLGRRLQLLSFDEVADAALTARAEPLIKGLLDRGAMSVLYGESNVGKTFVALDIADHIARGLPWAGMRTSRLPVLYIAAEGGRGLAKRVRALRSERGSADDKFQLVNQSIDLRTPSADLQPLLELIAALPAAPGLVVVDTLSRAMAGGDENSSVDMGVMVTHLDKLRGASGAHVMVVHHSGKDVARGARGHSLLRAATDTEIEVQEGRISVKKQRDHDGAWFSDFELRRVDLGLDDDGDIISSCVVRLRAGETENDLSEEQLQAIREEIGSGAWTETCVGKGARNWIGKPIAAALDIDTALPSAKARLQSIVNDLLRRRELAVKMTSDKKHGREVKRIILAPSWFDPSPLSPEFASPRLAQLPLTLECGSNLLDGVFAQ